MCRARFRFLCFLYLLSFTYFLSACHQAPQSKITIGSKFFTEQVVLAELLAQHIEASTGIPVIRKTNLGGTLLVHKALLAGELDLYVEYTGTALTAVLNETPRSDSAAVYNRVRQLYSERFHLEVTEPLGFEHFRHGRSRRRRQESSSSEDFRYRFLRAQMARRCRL